MGIEHVALPMEKSLIGFLPLLEEEGPALIERVCQNLTYRRSRRAKLNENGASS